MKGARFTCSVTHASGRSAETKNKLAVQAPLYPAAFLPSCVEATSLFVPLLTAPKTTELASISPQTVTVTHTQARKRAFCCTYRKSRSIQLWFKIKPKKNDTRNLVVVLPYSLCLLCKLCIPNKTANELNGNDIYPK